MAGIKIQKKYVSTNISNVNLANNWMVLVFGVTNIGPTSPTLVQSYEAFTSTFGQPVDGMPTHPYMKFLLDSGVSVLFKRIADTKAIAASFTQTNSTNEKLFTITASDAYIGSIGNKISINITRNSTTKACNFDILYDRNVVETFSLGQEIDGNIAELVYDFIDKAQKSISPVSKYVKFKIETEIKPLTDNSDQTNWSVGDIFPYAKAKALEKGSDTAVTLTSAMDVLSQTESTIYKDVKLLQAMTYYPQLRFVTTGGFADDNIDKQNQILSALGTFATKCNSAFRVLVDYGIQMTDIETVRTFARGIATEGKVSPAIYSYFGYWGYDSNGNPMPGSAGFLTALARSGYNVYSRRIAGTAYAPAYSKPYKEIYVDALADWQDENSIQCNPILIVDAQDNMAVMGASTLAMPTGTLTSRDPSQALDILLVSDYVAAILHNIAFSELESSLDRLSLSSLSNRMTQEVESFVTSGAITRYDFNFDTTQLGKLGIECILYFAIGLEEVSITVTSTYDTDLIS